MIVCKGWGTIDNITTLKQNSMILINFCLLRGENKWKRKEFDFVGCASGLINDYI